jgi:diacylglycerol O-acyltransferase / wax synthase
VLTGLSNFAAPTLPTLGSPTDPYVPIAGTMRISVGIFPYLDRITFGINADFDGVPDVQMPADGIRAGFDELVTATATA